MNANDYDRLVSEHSTSIRGLKMFGRKGGKPFRVAVAAILVAAVIGLGLWATTLEDSVPFGEGHPCHYEHSKLEAAKDYEADLRSQAEGGFVLGLRQEQERASVETRRLSGRFQDCQARYRRDRERESRRATSTLPQLRFSVDERDDGSHITELPK